jgi:hypothetical protein
MDVFMSHLLSYTLLGQQMMCQRLRAFIFKGAI